MDSFFLKFKMMLRDMSEWVNKKFQGGGLPWMMSWGYKKVFAGGSQSLIEGFEIFQKRVS